jgi:hypothetical protein
MLSGRVHRVSVLDIVPVAVRTLQIASQEAKGSLPLANCAVIHGLPFGQPQEASSGQELCSSKPTISTRSGMTAAQLTAFSHPSPLEGFPRALRLRARMGKETPGEGRSTVCQ